MSDEEIKRWSITELNNTIGENDEIANGSLKGEGELCDLRLGVTMPSEKCRLCGQDRECPGHFGHITLERPVFHIGYMQPLVKVLKCICPYCSKLKNPPNSKDLSKINEFKLIRDSVLKRARTKRNKKKVEQRDRETQGEVKKRLRNLAKLLENVNVCQKLDETEKNENDNQDPENQNQENKLYNIHEECRSKNLPVKIRIKEYHQVTYVKSDGDIEREHEWSAAEILEIVKKISEEDCLILGFGGVTKPKDLIIQSLLVPPPPVRPSISFSPNKPASHDDLTRVYQNILKQNAILKQLTAQNSPSSEINKVVHKMTLDIGRMMDNEKNALKTMELGLKKKKVKSIKSRLKGKEGRFRQNLMGKRVDFSARSVISGDANLHVDQLGVPRAIAFELTVPEEVTQHNRDFILELVKKDYIKTILVPDQKKEKDEYTAFSQMQNQGEMEKLIDYGVIVERYLMDGDYVLFNRQPTLHKMSMMGHRVKILPGSTFRLNLSVTTPYNADFDGDEMNMHVPQSTESQSELKNLCHVPKQIVTPKANKPVMGIVQDSLLGSCLFTLRDTFLTKQQVMILAMFILDWNGQLPMPAILRPEPLWTGKQIISMIIHDKIQLIKPGDDNNDVWMSLDDSTVVIEKGELLQGIMNKSIIGDGAGGLVHTVWLDGSPQMCCDFMTQAQRIVNNWLTMSGFTISCSDMVPMIECEQKIEDVMKESEKLWGKSLEKFQDAKAVEREQLYKPGTSIFISFEFEVNNILNDQRNKANKAATQQIPFRYNNFKRMVWSGSKGKDQNLAQVLGVVGQQNVEGRRVDMGFNRRTLPHFQRDTYGLSERGYVKRNFFRGLLPYEFFFHTMGGREGLSDTAVKTARTGYIQRKLVKAIEDVKVCYDGTVRESSGMILETSYGEDNMAAEFVEHQGQYKGIMRQNEQQFRQNYNFMQLTQEQRSMLDKKILEELPDEDDETSQLYQEFQELQESQELLVKCFVKPNKIENVYMPVDIGRIIRDIQMANKYSRTKQIELSPFLVYQKVQEFFGRLDDLYKKRSLENCLLLFKCHVRFALASKKIIFTDRLNADNLDTVIGEIEKKYYKAMIHPGESIGSMAAQSIGEPTTQMTLNTFHFAGSSDRNVTLGVPRLQELLDASRNIKTPSITIYFHPSLNMQYVGKKNSSEDQGNREREKIFQDFQHKLAPTKISDFIRKTEIYYNPNPKKPLIATGVGDNVIDLNPNEFEYEPWELVIYFKNLLHFQEIMAFFRNKLGSEFLPDEDQEQKIIWIRIQKGVGGNLGPDNKGDEDEDREGDDFYDEMEQQDLSKYAYHKLEKLENDIVNKYKLVEGVPGLTKIMHGSNEYEFLHLMRGQKLGKNDIYKEKYLLTEGTNLIQIYQFPEVDTTRTISNDVMEVTRILGIEAARKQMIAEMTSVFDKYSIYINARHMNVLIDWMTHRGGVIPCTRNGINRIPSVSCLRKSSFEETVEMLYDASVYSELDRMKGISENIIFGQKCTFGTNTFDIYIDYKTVQDAKVIPNKFINQSKFDQDEMYQGDTPEHNEYANIQTPYVGQTPLVMQTPHTVNHTPYNQGAFTPQASIMQNTNAISPGYYGGAGGGQSSVRSFTQSPAYTAHSPAYQPPQTNQYSPNSIGSASNSPGMSKSNSPSYSPQSSSSPSHNYNQSPSSPVYQASINSPSANFSNSNSSFSSKGQIYSPASPNYQSPQSQHSSGLPSATSPQQYTPQSNSPSYNSSYNQMSGYQQSSPSYKQSSSYHQPSSPQTMQSGTTPQVQPSEEYHKKSEEEHYDNIHEEDQEDDEEDDDE